MKTTLALFLLTVSSAAQMTNARLLKLDQQFAQATTKEHLDGWMRYIMDSTVIFAPQHYSGNLDGKEAIRTRYQDLFATPDFKMNWRPTSAQVLPSGATGYTKGTFHWVIPYSPCKCVSDWHGTYLAVWEEEDSAGGKWKLKALLPSLDATSSSCGCGS
jgi:ketosteroid isomerase-like protein